MNTFSGRTLFFLSGLIVHAVVFRLLWFWFATPLTDVAIDTVHAAGLIVTMYLLRGHYKPRPDINLNDELITAYVVPILCFIVGALLRLMMHPLNYAPKEGLFP